MNKRTRIAISSVCGLVALLASVGYAQHVRGEAERARSQALARYGGEVASLVVSLRSIEAGEVVTNSDVEDRDWLVSLAPSHAITEPADVIGREVTVPVEEGAPLTELNFRDASQIAEIPSGHVAVSVPITDRLGVSAAIRVGAHVTAYRTAEDVAEVICADAIVLAVPSSSGTIASHGTLTVAVKDNDVSRILMASTSGDLRLVVPADDVKQEKPTNKDAGKNVAPKEDGDTGNGGE